ELQQEIDQSYEKADGSEDKPRHGSQAERDPRMTRETGHRNIVKRIEIVLGDATHALRLNKRDLGAGVSEFCNQAAEIGPPVGNAAQHLDDLSVVKAITSKILDQGRFGDFIENAIIGAAEPKHDRGFAARRLDRYHHLGTVAPEPNEFLQEFRGILQVASH